MNAVLDREVSEESSAAVRRHVTACARCQEEFGELFEVESLALAVARPPVALPRRRSWIGPLLAAAAALVAVAWILTERSRTTTNPAMPATLDSSSTGASAPPIALPAAPSAPPRLFASHSFTTEFVLDDTGVRATTRRTSDLSIETTALVRFGSDTEFAWSLVPLEIPR